MAEKISDLSGEERERRIAELKQKMLESAKRKGSTQSEASAQPAPATTTVDEEPEKIDAVDSPEPTVESPPLQTVTVAPEASVPAKASAAAKPAAARPSSNGSTPEPAAQPEGPSKTEMNRREFLTYAWGGALGLLALEGAALSFMFMYPRFKAGEFGGVFGVNEVIPIPNPEDSPRGYPKGKFWLISNEENEPKALFMVCTHLGCLYQWVESNSRFECPCHGSKFTRDGNYIEGPAPRSLDTFDIEVVNGRVLVDTGAKTVGAPAAESPANASLA